MGGKSIAALIAMGLMTAACGGGGSSDSGSGGSSGGGSPQTEAPPPPPPEPGLDADENTNNDVWVDEQVRGGIVPGYVTMGMVQLALDTAEAAQPYQARLAETLPDNGVGSAIECDRGSLMPLAWDDADADNSLSSGDSVDFDFADCVFTAAERTLRSEAPQQTLEVVPDGGRYQLDGVQVDGYPSAQVAQGNLVWDGSRLLSGGETALLASGNGYEIGLGQEAGSPLAIQVTEHASGAQSVVIDDVRITVDDGTETTEYRIRTTLPLTVRQTASGLEVFDPDGEGGEDGGAFVVQDLTNNVTYHYTLASDPTCLWVMIDEGSNNSWEAEGQVDQNLILDRLELD